MTIPLGGPEPDIVALRLRVPAPGASGGLAVAQAPPRIGLVATALAEASLYALKANRIAIRQGLGRVVAMIEVVSPGNKDTRSAAASFVTKAVDFLRHGVHFLMVDPFPAGPRDPQGLAQQIWQEIADAPLPARPAGKPMTIAAFDAGSPISADVEGIGVGDELPEAPLFLEPGWYVNVPLEATYRTSWGLTPRPIRDLVETNPA